MKNGIAVPELTLESLSEDLLAADLDGDAKNFFYLVRLSEDRARDFFEQARWPRGPACVACKRKDVSRVRFTGPWRGHYACDRCDACFMVTTGTILEGSPLPLRTWLLAAYLLSCIENHVNAVQLARILKLNYTSSWRLAKKVGRAVDPQGKPFGRCSNVEEAVERLMGR